MMGFSKYLITKLNLPRVGMIVANRNLTSTCTNSYKKLQSISLLHSKLRERKFTTNAKSEQNQTAFIDVTAYATSDEYKFDSLKNFLKSQTSTTLKELPEDALDVLQVEMNVQPSELFKGYFLFREGSVVFWNCSNNEKAETLTLLSRFRITPYDQSVIDEQSETFKCCIADNKSALINGDIHLQRLDNHSFDPLEMLAFSNAISHSVKLAVWEVSLDEDVTSNKSLLKDLRHGRKLRTSMEDVLKRCGNLYSLRYHINLGSNLLDSPDFYWDRSDIEKLYLKTCQFLNIPLRTRVINEKLHHSVDFVELIRDHLKDKHHTRLELMIIFLIMIEVFFGSCHFLEKYLLNKDVDK